MTRIGPMKPTEFPLNLSSETLLYSPRRPTLRNGRRNWNRRRYSRAEALPSRPLIDPRFPFHLRPNFSFLFNATIKLNGSIQSRALLQTSISNPKLNTLWLVTSPIPEGSFKFFKDLEMSLERSLEHLKEFYPANQSESNSPLAMRYLATKS